MNELPRQTKPQRSALGSETLGGQVDMQVGAANASDAFKTRAQMIAKGVQSGLSRATISKQVNKFMGLMRDDSGGSVMASEHIPFAKNSFGAQPMARLGIKEGYQAQLGYQHGTFRNSIGSGSFSDWAAESRGGSGGTAWSASRDPGLGFAGKSTWNWQRDRGLGTRLSEVMGWPVTAGGAAATSVVSGPDPMDQYSDFDNDPSAPLDNKTAAVTQFKRFGAGHPDLMQGLENYV